MKLKLPYRHIALLALCATFGSMLTFEILAPVEQPELPKIASRPEPAPAPPPAAFTPPSPQAFLEIDDRFVFSPFRQQYKIPPVIPPPPPPPPPPNIVLLGIIIDGSSRLAIVKLPGTPVASTLTTGAAIAGWQIDQIEVDHIALHSGDAKHEFRLQYQRAPQQGG